MTTLPKKKLGFGCMRLPLTDPQDTTAIDQAQVEAMFDLFLERGFTYVDTAYVYHNGESEKMVGKALVARHPRESFTVATKMPTMRMRTEADNERIFKEQLERTQLEYFDYYLMHALSSNNYGTAQSTKMFEFGEKMKAEGKIKNLGFSFHDTAEMLEKILTDHPDVDFVQLQINYLDWEDPIIQSRLCYETCVRHGKKVVVMEPIKGGTLARLPEEAAKLMKDYAPDRSLASWAIRFVASLPEVMTVLSGMSNMEQMDDNTAYMENFEPLSDEEQAILKKVVEVIRSRIAFNCTACEYCVPGCPMSIPIPKWFEMYNQDYSVGNEGGHKWAYNQQSAEGGKASTCVHCRQCENVCPQHLPITEYLEQVAATYEG